MYFSKLCLDQLLFPEPVTILAILHNCPWLTSGSYLVNEGGRKPERPRVPTSAIIEDGPAMLLRPKTEVKFNAEQTYGALQ